MRAHLEAELLPPLLDLLTPPEPLPWYPDRLAWKVGVSRAGLRGKGGADDAAAREALRQLHAFLMEETKAGRVHRQEAASMVPPLLLDVQPGMRVLDMCASPGSKAQQLLELLGADGGGSGGGGLLVANDADFTRSNVIASRASKLHSTELLICCHDGRHLPEVLSSGDKLEFDRVLCDVPCTGDGTLRKALQRSIVYYSKV